MAFAERAELVARLSLDNRNFLTNARTSAGALKGMEGSLGRIAGHANRGLRTAAGNLAKIGAVAGGFVALNVRSGIESLATLEDAVTSVDGAIKQMGLTGRLTGQQVATWANEIEESVQRAFDDKEIAQAATTLLRFGRVSDKNLRPALVVMTDLAAKTGDVGSASTLLARALADPTAAAGKLARAGVILNDETQKRLKQLVRAGKLEEAQALLLKEVEKATKGAAAASKGPYRDALNILADVTEDTQRALGEAFLPLLGRVADKLSTFLADPKNIERIREFGRDLAKGFERVLAFAGQIPWGMIGDSLKIAGAGAKAVFDAFTSLPPWVQTAVVTSWGLNKLTGGALSSIVSELGKGLIKGVLGMNAGVVNARAGVVNVVGGGLPGGRGPGAVPVGGIRGGAGSLATGVRILGTVALAGASILAISELWSERQRQSDENKELGEDLILRTQTFKQTATLQQMRDALAGVEGQQRRLAEGLTPESFAYALNIDGVADRINETKAELKAGIAALVQKESASLTAAERTKGAMVQSLSGVKSATDRSYDAIERTRGAIFSASASDRNAIVGAIARNRPIVNVRVSVRTSSVTKNYTTGTQTNRQRGETEYDI